MSKTTEMNKAAEAAKTKKETMVEGATPVSPIPTEVPSTDAPKSGETALRADASAKPAESTPTKAESTPAEPKVTDKPAKPKAPEMVLISKKEYDAVREVLTVQKGLGENLLKMQELAKSLGDDLTAAKTEIAGLRKTVDALNAQLDCLVEKPVLVYVAKFKDGEELIAEDEATIYATGKLPVRLVTKYAWKADDGYEPLTDDELEERGLENP